MLKDMLKKFKFLLVIVLLIIASGCSSNLSTINSIEELADKKIGIYNGSEYDRYLENSEYVYYNTYSDEISALKSGKIDAFLTDEPLANDIIKNNNGLKVLNKKITNDSYAFAINKDNKKLKIEIDKVIIQMKKDGILNQFKNKWMNSDNENLETYDYVPTKTLNFATVSGSAPFAYLKNNQIVGYDIDVINYIGYKLGYKINIVEMAWDGVLPSIISRKTDVAGCSIIVTEDRKKSVLFSEPTYSGGIVAVTRGEDIEEHNIITSIERTLKEDNRYLTLLKGFKNTLIISVLSILLGTLLGILICYFRNKKNIIVSGFFKAFISLIQGIPITLLLLIFYYIIFAKISISAIIVAIITFSIYFSAYIAEIIRGALDSINKEQIMSAKSLGFTNFQTIRYIIIPQMLCYFIPTYKNEVVSLIKLTSIAGYISIIDITRASDLIRNRTYEAFIPLIIAAILYFIICFIASKVLDYIYYKVDKRARLKYVGSKKNKKRA